MISTGPSLRVDQVKIRLEQLTLKTIRDVQFNKLPKKPGFDFAQPSSVEESRDPRWLSGVVGIASLLRENQNPQISEILFPRKSFISLISWPLPGYLIHHLIHHDRGLND